ncbi:MAG TPA: hypothetical protein VF247_03975 [Candidatus Krumholzibacteria bacterium]
MDRAPAASYVPAVVAMPVQHNGSQPSAEEERAVREAALDETIEASFPASDPPSSLPNPADHEALVRQRSEDR